MITFSVFVEVTSLAVLCCGEPPPDERVKTGGKRSRHGNRDKLLYIWKTVSICNPVLWFFFIPVTIYFDFGKNHAFIVTHLSDTYIFSSISKFNLNITVFPKFFRYFISHNFSIESCETQEITKTCVCSLCLINSDF